MRRCFPPSAHFSPGLHRTTPPPHYGQHPLSGATERKATKKKVLCSVLTAGGPQGHKEASDVSPADAPATPEEPHQHQHHQHVASSREQRRERRRELLEAAKQELEWRVFIASRKSHESTTSATPPPPSAVATEPSPAPPVADAAASPTTKSSTTANDQEEHPGPPILPPLPRSNSVANTTHNTHTERKREDLGRRMMRRRLRRVARESRDHRLPVPKRERERAGLCVWCVCV
jgi:hypothetical protein